MAAPALLGNCRGINVRLGKGSWGTFRAGAHSSAPGSRALFVSIGASVLHEPVEFRMGAVAWGEWPAGRNHV
jgi:hypothetical protein